MIQPKFRGGASCIRAHLLGGIGIAKCKDSPNIHSKKRNRLEPSRANDLVYECSNLHLLKRIQSAEYDEEYPEWDSDEE